MTVAHCCCPNCNTDFLLNPFHRPQARSSHERLRGVACLVQFDSHRDECGHACTSFTPWGSSPAHAGTWSSPPGASRRSAVRFTHTDYIQVYLYTTAKRVLPVLRQRACTHTRPSSVAGTAFVRFACTAPFVVRGPSALVHACCIDRRHVLGPSIACMHPHRPQRRR
jgi:hypothetical protein